MLPRDIIKPNYPCFFEDGNLALDLSNEGLMSDPQAKRVARIRQYHNEPPTEPSRGDMHLVQGLGEEDGYYFVKTWNKNSVTESYVSQARKITLRVSDRGENATYYRDLKEVDIPPKKVARPRPLRPNKPLYKALAESVRDYYRTDFVIK